MPGKSFVHGFSAVALSFALAAAAGAQTSAPSLPAPVQEGGVSYISGGFGQDQSGAFKAAIPSHSVTLVFSEAGGAYLADIPVQLESADGAHKVEMMAVGPYVLLDLPDGKYTAHAIHADRKISKNFTVAGNKGQRIGFTW